MAQAPTLDEWAHAGIIPIDLPSYGDAPAYTVQYELTDLTGFVAAGRIPNPLLPLALRIEAGEVAEDKLTAEEVADYLELQCIVIAGSLRDPDLSGLDDPVEWVKAHVPPLHRRKIWEVAMHMDLPEAVKSLLEVARFRDGAPSRDVPRGRRKDRPRPERGAGDHVSVLRSLLRRGPRGS